ncbi:MAG: murein biosynthesis integral membrane protein MurJ [Candidatus Ratteibacteria bacterium]|jgi:putative peptidoglycan lipid II flippase
MTFQKVKKSFILLSLVTVLCRVAGLFREMVTARYFGTSGVYDAFLLAFMIPNFFRGLLAEGALSTCFIPVFSEYVADPEKKKESREVASAVFTFLFTATLLLYLLILGISWFLLKTGMLSPKIAHVALLLRVTFPYLLFVSLAAWCMGILNTYRSFLLPGLHPLVLDFFWIASLLFFAPRFGAALDKTVYVLGIGVILGGAGQFLVQVPLVAKVHGPLRFNWNWRHPALKQMLMLFSPVIVGTAVGPINLLVDYSFAHRLSGGMVSALWYATRIYQLPLGIIGVSLATVLLPHLSLQAARNDLESVRDHLNKSLTHGFFFLIPAAAWIAVYRTETVTALFMRGNFDLYSVQITSFALLFFSIGIPFYGVAMLLTRGFYAFKDTLTPVKIGLFSITVNAVLDATFMRFWGQGGIAFATSVVGILNYTLLYSAFRRKFGSCYGSGIVPRIFSISLLSGGWAVALEIFRRFFISVNPWISILAGGLGGAILYLGIAYLLRFPEVRGWRQRSS